MEAKFQTFLILLGVLAATALVARRFNVAPAILLMLAGVGLAFVPGMPPVELPPELVLLLVLPPLIYSASVAMSWREFWNSLRPIVLLAVGAVIFTAAMVAAATHYLIGLPWNVGFLLGAIVATALILYRFALAAIIVGHFSLPLAAGEFVLIVAGEIAFGIGVGWLSL